MHSYWDALQGRSTPLVESRDISCINELTFGRRLQGTWWLYSPFAGGELKKPHSVRLSCLAALPPPFAFCLPGSWTSESNFRTDKIRGFLPPPTQEFFFFFFFSLAGYHVKHHMEQIKPEEQGGWGEDLCSQSTADPTVTVTSSTHVCPNTTADIYSGALMCCCVYDPMMSLWRRDFIDSATDSVIQCYSSIIQI